VGEGVSASAQYKFLQKFYKVVAFHPWVFQGYRYLFFHLPLRPWNMVIYCGYHDTWAYRIPNGPLGPSPTLALNGSTLSGACLYQAWWQLCAMSCRATVLERALKHIPKAIFLMSCWH
jgi:hypothetical protein